VRSNKQKGDPGLRLRVTFLLVGLASALGSLGSGFIFATLGYNMMAFISAAFAFIPLLFASFWTLSLIRKTPAFS